MPESDAWSVGTKQDWKQHSGSAVLGSEEKAQCSQQVRMRLDIDYGRFKDLLKLFFIYL